MADLTDPGVRVLLVGTGTHDQGSLLPDVEAASPSVAGLGQCLVETCKLPENHLQILSDPVDPLMFDAALANTAQSASSLLFLYYIGHGVVGSDAQLYLATKSTMDLLSGPAPHYQALPYRRVRDVLANSHAKSVIVILDCCFSERASTSLITGTDDIYAIIGVHDSYLLTSAAREEHALAPPGEQYTSFTGALIDLLSNGDPGGPPKLTLERAYRYLARSLPKEYRPEPRRTASGNAGDLILTVNTAYQPPVIPKWSLPDERLNSEEACPYLGLAAFDEEDARFFFGRERLTANLIDSLNDRLTHPRPMVVFGASGAGKSSLLNAGMRASLGKGALKAHGSWEWPQAVLVPGTRPLANLAEHLAPLIGLTTDEIRRNLIEDSEGLIVMLRQSLQRRLWSSETSAKSPRLILIIDQFEEVFSSTIDEPERSSFIRAICALSTKSDDNPIPPVMLIIGIRADTYARCADYAQLHSAMTDGLVVPRMLPTEFDDVIKKPAREAGLDLQDGLVEILYRDLGLTNSLELADAAPRDAGVLPLLSHALRETWQQRSGRILTVEGYRSIGGVANSVATTADQILADLNDDERTEAKQLLLGLVHVGETALQDYRRRRDLRELIASRPDSNLTIAVLNAFAADQARLISADEDTVAITHDALLRFWPTLRDWIETDRASLLLAQRLIEDARTWEAEEKDTGRLYRGSQLARVTEWSFTGNHGADLPAVTRAFLDASRASEARRTRRRTATIISMALLLVLSLLGTIGALVQRQTALHNQGIATAERLLAEAQNVWGNNPQLALQLALAANTIEPTTGSADVLGTLLAQSHYAGMIRDPTVRVLSFSPSTRILATAGRGFTLWRITRQYKEIHLTTVNFDTYVTSIAFSTDGQTLATATSGGTTVLWSLADPQIPRREGEINLNSFINTVAFSPDGRTLAIGSDDAATLWDISSHLKPVRLTTVLRFNGVSGTVVFNHDGRLLATSDITGHISIWNLADKHHPVRDATIVGSGLNQPALAFSPVTNVLASGTPHNQVILWSLANPYRPRRQATMSAQKDSIWTLAFSHDGRVLATGSLDQTVVLWGLDDLSRPKVLATLTGQASQIESLSFSPDGLSLASVGSNGVPYLWDLVNIDVGVSRLGVLNEHITLFNNNSAITFAPTNQILAIGDFSGSVHLWNIANRSRPVQLAKLQGFDNMYRTGFVTELAYSQDGHLLASGDSNGNVGLWNVSNVRHPVRLAVLNSGMDWVTSLAFSPSGHILVGGANNGIVAAWNVAEQRHPGALRIVANFKGRGDALSFSHDGHMLAVAGDGTIGLFKLTSTHVLDRIDVVHGDWASALAFSLSGQSLIAASSDGSVTSWNLSDTHISETRITLGAHAEAGGSPILSSDGMTLARPSASSRSVALWDLSDLAHPRLVTSLRVPQSLSVELAFSRDEQSLAVAADTSVALWRVTSVTRSSLNAVRRACIIASEGFNQAQWTKYVQNVSYQRSCPK